MVIFIPLFVGSGVRVEVGMGVAVPVEVEVGDVGMVILGSGVVVVVVVLETLGELLEFGGAVSIHPTINKESSITSNILLFIFAQVVSSFLLQTHLRYRHPYLYTSDNRTRIYKKPFYG